MSLAVTRISQPPQRRTVLRINQRTFAKLFISNAGNGARSVAGQGNDLGAKGVHKRVSECLGSNILENMIVYSPERNKEQTSCSSTANQQPPKSGTRNVGIQTSEPDAYCWESGATQAQTTASSNSNNSVRKICDV